MCGCQAEGAMKSSSDHQEATWSPAKGKILPERVAPETISKTLVIHQPQWGKKKI